MGTVKIVDFGFCTYADKTEETTAITRHAYLAPEMSKGKQIDGAVDVWSIAVLMHLMLSGFMPAFDRILNKKSPLGFTEFATVSLPAKQLLLGMLV